MMASVQELATSIAGHGLTPGPITLRPLHDEELTALLAHVEHERLEGLLVAAIVDGSLPITDEQSDTLDAFSVRAGTTALLLERSLLEAAHVLDEAGIDFRVLKGLALGRWLYADPSLRTSSDVDLLIRGNQWDESVTALSDAGATRPVPEVRRGFDHRFGKEATLVDRHGYEIDLHRTFVIGPFGLTIDLDELFDRRLSIDVGSRALWALNPEAALVQACVAVAIADRSTPLLHTLRDIVELLRWPVDGDAVVDLAHRWRMASVVARGIQMASSTLISDGNSLERWAASHRPTRMERVLLHSYLQGARSFTSQAAGALVVPGARDKLTYLHALIWPDASYLSSRGFTRVGHWRRALGRAWHTK